MYLSHVQLRNWRSYDEADFRFAHPTPRRPLVLIGAMNGAGKTSFLVALYLGLFGRFGLRHAEGFSDKVELGYYRGALNGFRRIGAHHDEPTSIDLTFTPTQGEDESEVRVVRRWYFDPLGKALPTDRFEQVDLYVDGAPMPLHSGVDAAQTHLERLLFPAQFMPAFFFDGEQAQSLILEDKSRGIKQAVEVVYGTKLVEETRERIRDLIREASKASVGKRAIDSRQTRLTERDADRERLESIIADLKRTSTQLLARRHEIEHEERGITEELSRLGGERALDLEAARDEVVAATKEAEDADRHLREATSRMGVALAISRLAPAIRNRLVSEQLREEWLSVKRKTIDKTEAILAHAIPEPPESDPLLGHLAPHLREKVRERFAEAIQLIYHPPPTDCAQDYLFGFATGDARDRLLALVDEARGVGMAEIKERARRVKQARERLTEAKDRFQRIGDLPAEVDHLKGRLAGLDAEKTDLTRQLGGVENELESRKGELTSVSKEIGELREAMARLEPEARRVAVAERVQSCLAELDEHLAPLTIRKLRGLITQHFTRVADRRFQDGEIVFKDNEQPVLRQQGREDQPIDTMSGFERRAFGIAFSLALAEITRRRIPLVIDTPLGNADSEYRKRLLEALTDVELDQIIILPHDAEVPPVLMESMSDSIRQTFLIEFDRQSRRSIVRDSQYFARGA